MLPEGFLSLESVGDKIANIFKDDEAPLDPDEKYLTLSYPIHYEVNYRIFYDKLEDFVNYLSFWRYEIQNYGSRQV